MNEVGTRPGKGREETELSLLVETARALTALRQPRDHQTGGVGKRRRVSPEEGQREEDEVGDEGPLWREKEEEWMSDDRRHRQESRRLERDTELRMLQLLSELSATQSGRVTAFKDALGLSTRILSIAPLESGVPPQSTQTDNTITDEFCSHLFYRTLQRVENMLRTIEVKMNSINAELDAANTALCAEGRPHSDPEKQASTALCAEGRPHSDPEKQASIALCAEGRPHSDPEKQASTALCAEERPHSDPEKQASIALCAEGRPHSDPEKQASTALCAEERPHSDPEKQASIALCAEGRPHSDPEKQASTALCAEGRPHSDPEKQASIALCAEGRPHSDPEKQASTALCAEGRPHSDPEKQASTALCAEERPHSDPEKQASTALCAEGRPHSDPEKQASTEPNMSHRAETPQTPCEPQLIGCSPRVASVPREPLGLEPGNHTFDRDIGVIRSASLSHRSPPESGNPPDTSPKHPLLESCAVEDCSGTRGEPQRAGMDPGTPTATGEEAEGTTGGKGAYVTVGMTAQSPDGQSEVSDACYVTAPVGVAEALTCEVADALSSLVVIGSEELVSRVLRVEVRKGALCHFPITLVVPFGARYRGNYREVVVKVMDGERRASYITPISTESTYGGQRGSYAEVRVYAVGLLAVVSRLRRESYTVPRRGVSIKLSVDPRVCLDYLPGSFPATVVAQSMIQPVDATLLAALKSRSDWSPAVVSTSPVLHLTHPSSLPLRRPLTVTLPCPPNPDQKRAGQGGEVDPRARCVSAAPMRERLAPHRLRALSASVKTSREATGEALVLLGWREEQWNVLDHVAVRNLLNGLVALELTEIFDRLMVVRLLSSVRPSHLTSLAEEVEEAVRCHTVTVVLLRHREEAHAAVAAALLTRDLSWELSKLRAQGYSGPPETSQDIPMCEGEQLLVSFSGNITSTAFRDNPNHAWGEPITFHSQRKSRVFLRLTEVDSFGNHSSPHYKGTAIFHRVARDQLEWRGDRAVPLCTGPPGNPVCKLPLTLPKKVRVISRPFSAQAQVHDETAPLSDPLLRWLSQELSEEEVASLVLRLRLPRSSVQLVRLQAPDSLPAQAFHLLAAWRRGLPAAPHPAKAAQLAGCLAKSGRPDLARELLLRQASTGGFTDK